MLSLLKKLFPTKKKELHIVRLEGKELDLKIEESKKGIHSLRMDLMPLQFTIKSTTETIATLEKIIAEKRNEIKKNPTILGDVISEETKEIQSKLKSLRKTIRSSIKEVDEIEIEIDILEQTIEVYEHWKAEDQKRIDSLHPPKIIIPTPETIGPILFQLVSTFFEEQPNRFVESGHHFSFFFDDNPHVSIRYYVSLEEPKLTVLSIGDDDEIERVILSANAESTNWKLTAYRTDDFCDSLYRDTKSSYFNFN